MNESMSPSAGHASANRPWYRGTTFGLVLVAVFLSTAAAILLIKNRPDKRRDSDHSHIADPFDFSTLTVDRDEVLSGGPGLDGIPSLTTAEARGKPDPFANEAMWRGDHPSALVSSDQADFLQPDSRVVGVTLNGQSRAYPIGVLNWHECVNDVLGGVPIAVTYCPLCDSVTILDRRVGEGSDQVIVELGISGYLYNSNVLLYDRQERNLWSQISLQAIAGPRAGSTLKHLDNWSLMRWDRWKQAHADSDVVSFDTGYERSYAQNPYQGFAESDRLMFPVAEDDDRLPLKQRIIGVRYGDQIFAFVVSTGPRQIRHTFADGKAIVLTIDDTGGVAIVNQPEGAQSIHTFWYAWAATYPGTEIVH